MEIFQVAQLRLDCGKILYKVAGRDPVGGLSVSLLLL